MKNIQKMLLCLLCTTLFLMTSCSTNSTQSVEGEDESITTPSNQSDTQIVENINSTADSTPKVNSPTLDECVEKSIVFDFHKEEIPNEMIDSLSDFKVLMVGEMHYVQEHHEFMQALIKSLHTSGTRYFLQETSYASGRTIDYYIKSKIPTISEEFSSIDKIVIESLREFNTELRNEGREDEQITYIGFDMNHWGNEYSYSIKTLSTLYPSQYLSDYYESLKTKSIDTENYTKLLSSFLDGISDTSINNELKAELTKLTETELTSVGLRTIWDDNGREDFITDRVMETITSSNEKEKILINTGLWHAQLEPEWTINDDSSFNWLGMRLKAYFADTPDGLFSLSTTAIKGLKKSSYYSSERSTFEVPSDDESALLNRLDAKSEGKYVFLDYTKLINNKEKIKVHYTHSQVKLKLNTQFNGILVYPEANVATSTLYYE